MSGMIQVGTCMLYKCVLCNYAPVLVLTETQVSYVWIVWFGSFRFWPSS